MKRKSTKKIFYGKVVPPPPQKTVTPSLVLPIEIIESFIDYPSTQLKVCDYLHLLATCQHFYDLYHFNVSFKTRVIDLLISLTEVHEKCVRDPLPKYVGVHWIETQRCNAMAHALLLEDIIVSKWKSLINKDNLYTNCFEIFPTLNHLFVEYVKTRTNFKWNVKDRKKEVAIDSMMNAALFYTKHRIESMYSVKMFFPTKGEIDRLPLLTTTSMFITFNYSALEVFDNTAYYRL